MGDSPAVLRALRATGAVALGAAALVLALGGSPAVAAATPVLTTVGTDPSADGDTVAWQLPGGGPGILQHAGAPGVGLPGTDPALGPQTVVWREGDQLVVADQATLAPLLRVPAPGAQEPAVSARWLVWRAHEGSSDVLRAVDRLAPEQPPVELRRVAGPGAIGRPSIDGDRVVFGVATRAAGSIEEIFLPTRRRTALRSVDHGALLLNPSELAGRLLYVRSSPQGQELLLGPRRERSAAADKPLYVTHPTARRDAVHEPGHGRHGAGYPGRRPPPLPPRAPAGVDLTLWTTALAPSTAYVTSIRRTAAGTTTQILALTRR
jgi:hypothetical protein